MGPDYDSLRRCQTRKPSSMESLRRRAKANQQHDDSDCPITSTVKKTNTTFVASREPFQISKSTSPIPQTSRLSFAQKSDPKRRKANKYINLICEAIEEIGDEKKGASVQAMKKWILGKYPEIQERFFKTGIKNALAKGLQEGTLARPAKSKFSNGAVGSYCLVKKTGKPPKVKTVKQPDAYASDTELTINRGRVMSLRFNLSDTELAEVRKCLAFDAKPKRRGGKFQKVATDSADNSDQDSNEDEQIEPVVKAQTKKVTKASKAKKTAPKKPERREGKSGQKVEADENEDSDEEKIEPVIKAQTKKVTKASKAKETAPIKPPRKAATSKTKDEKNAPSKPKQDSRNKRKIKEKDGATK